MQKKCWFYFTAPEEIFNPQLSGPKSYVEDYLNAVYKIQATATHMLSSNEDTILTIYNIPLYLRVVPKAILVRIPYQPFDWLLARTNQREAGYLRLDFHRKPQEDPYVARLLGKINELVLWVGCYV